MAKAPFDKYYYYTQSVQSTEADVEFFAKTYRELKEEDARIFQEDFCGTFALSCEWVKTQNENIAYGIDLDPEPIAYGQEHYLSQLNDHQKERVVIAKKNVLNDPENPLKPHIIAGLNFSYFIFKDRATMKDYFQRTYDALDKDGVFFLDSFGGSKCCEANEEETEDEELGYSYYWDQDSYDPITNEAKFYIHFKRKGEPKRMNVFSYDWRMWSIPEVRDIMAEVGFKETHVYWEGTDEDGEGDGVYSRTTEGEECESWVAYIVGVK